MRQQDKIVVKQMQVERDKLFGVLTLNHIFRVLVSSKEKEDVEGEAEVGRDGKPGGARK